MNTPEQNIIKTLKGKKVLFLEDDMSLQNGLEIFEDILKRTNIEYKIIFSVSEKPLVELTNEINKCDCIVFMTQWVYDISKKLFEYVKSLKEKKIIIEVYISEPTWHYKSQHKSKHDVYIYSCQSYFSQIQKETEEFFKLSDNPYWDYKNKFDK